MGLSPQQLVQHRAPLNPLSLLRNSRAPANLPTTWLPALILLDMFFLLSVLERLARFLPQTLRVEIAAFLADRLIRALDMNTIPLHRIAQAELRLLRLLTAFAIARWRWICGDDDATTPVIRGGHLARSRASLRERLIQTCAAFNDLDSFVAALLVGSRAVRWRAFTRTPRRITSRLIARVRAIFTRLDANPTPPVASALELSG